MYGNQEILLGEILEQEKKQTEILKSIQHYIVELSNEKYLEKLEKHKKLSK